MLRDGALAPLWGDAAFVGASEPTAADRARALAPLVPARGVVARQSAVWVHTGSHAPRRADVAIPLGARRPAAHPERTVTEATLDPSGIVLLGGVRVTSVQRTGIDVARWLDPVHAEPLLAALVACGFDAHSASADLEHAGGRHVVRARAVLRGLAGVSG